MRLEGKVAFVTGAGVGMGREIALRFAAEGARIAATDINPETAASTAGEIEGGLALEVDVTSASSITSGLDAAIAEFGRIDVLVNNAGILVVGAAHDLTEEQWDSQIDANLKSVYLASKAIWPHLVDNGGGVILNTGSIYGIWAAADDAAYCASKAGVVMLTKCMALDGARDGIRVNCICPGYIRTPMLDAWFDDQSDAKAGEALLEGLTPLGRLGESADIASGMVYMASDDAEWVTGSILTIDGGVITGIWSGG